MSGDEHALSAAELETKARDRDSRQLMGSAPSEVPGTISTAQLHFFFLFLVQLSCFMPISWSRIDLSVRLVWIDLQIQFWHTNFVAQAVLSCSFC